MNPNQEEALWQHLAKALFGVDKTSDEGLFTYRVMARIRQLQPDLAWPRFLRWAVPVLGLGLASLVLALRGPVALTSPSMETALFQQQSLDEDPLSPVLEDFQ